MTSQGKNTRRDRIRQISKDQNAAKKQSSFHHRWSRARHRPQRIDGQRVDHSLAFFLLGEAVKFWTRRMDNGTMSHLLTWRLIMDEMELASGSFPVAMCLPPAACHLQLFFLFFDKSSSSSIYSYSELYISFSQYINQSSYPYSLPGLHGSN